MNKNFIYKLLTAIVIVAAGVLWLLSEVIPDTFGWFNFAFATAIFCGGVGLLLVFKGVFKKNSESFKKANIWFGIGLLMVTAVSLVFAFALPKSYIAPIICIMIGFGFILAIVSTGGNNFDKGDNQKTDYKTYAQRKAESQKASSNSKNTITNDTPTNDNMSNNTSEKD